MSNAFDEAFDALEKVQRPLRDQSHFYFWWLRFAGQNMHIVTLQERINIFTWLTKNYDVVDKNGVIRAQILKHIPLKVIHELIDTQNLDPYPRAMRAVARQRLGLE
jgi:hypothetical protein